MNYNTKKTKKFSQKKVIFVFRENLQKTVLIATRKIKQFYKNNQKKKNKIKFKRKTSNSIKIK